MTLKFMSELYHFHFSYSGERYEVKLERESLLENWFVTVLNNDKDTTVASYLGEKSMAPDRHVAQNILEEHVKIEE